jgi:alkaline phosphatase D|tara:strand:- start:10680 stop:11795 length:1116 start_codon:yes stop_codon:yes gene_type:complete
MNRLYPSIIAGLSLSFVACKPNTSSTAGRDSENASEATQPQIFKVAFGSCSHQSHPLPIFHEVIKQQPDLFVFLGDNVYGDTTDMEVLRQKYQQLGNQPSFQALKKNTPIEAIWDDHDYGRNDAGKNYPQKQTSKEIFLDFFAEPKDSDRFKHEGIYAERIYQVGDKKVQLILLDGRTFRDDLLRNSKPPNQPSQKKSFYHWDYIPHTDTSTTLLGEQQWQWLEKTLQQPADCRILATGTQFGIEANGYEAWANFPHEQKRLVKLIKKTQANHLIAISGDVHYAEVSKFQNPHSYPIYDITASGLSRTWRFATPNKNRIEGPIMKNHFGLLTIDFSATQPNIKTEIWDITGNQRVEFTIPLQDISFNAVKE